MIEEKMRIGKRNNENRGIILRNEDIEDRKNRIGFEKRIEEKGSKIEIRRNKEKSIEKGKKKILRN